MDTGYFTSKYFVIAALVAALIVGGAAAGYQLDGIVRSHGSHGGCDAPILRGSPLAATPATEIEDEGERRVVTYRLPAGSFTAGALDACSPFGEIVVDPSLDDSVEVRFTIEASYAVSVEETEVDATFRDNGGALEFGAWVAELGDSRTAFNDESASVRLEIRVPEIGAWDVRAHSSAGDIHVSDIMVGELEIESSFGENVATGVDLAGNATVETSAGDVILSFASVQSGTITADSSFGEVEIELPSRADVGYDVTGETSFGEVTIRIGPTEAYDAEGTSGERETARSAGYDSKPTKVTVSATSSAGDIRIVANGTTTTER